MCWLITGTFPRDDLPIVHGVCALEEGVLKVGKTRLAISRGVSALIAAACLTSNFLKQPTPVAVIVGDTGKGKGSKMLYDYLPEFIWKHHPRGITFHYLHPDIDGHNRVFMAMGEMPWKPITVADAGFMYVAKMSGFASSYDLFTPDIGEMAFLADELAPHPFYTRGFLFEEEDQVPALVRMAYEQENAARVLLIKGSRDYIAQKGEILYVVDRPSIEAMEAIGGTGDTLTGIVTSWISSGVEIPRACFLAARANRIMGLLANPLPSTQIRELLSFLPQALAAVSDGNLGKV